MALNNEDPRLIYECTDSDNDDLAWSKSNRESDNGNALLCDGDQGLNNRNSGTNNNNQEEVNYDHNPDNDSMKHLKRLSRLNQWTIQIEKQLLHHRQ
jgi:hypothetical protein